MKINLVKIETRSRRETWYRVDINDKPVGLVTKSRDDRSTTNPWKAFLGIGEPQYFLGVVYAKQPGKGYNIVARETAVDAVIAAWQGLDVSGNEFEKTYGIESVIPAWNTARPEFGLPAKSGSVIQGHSGAGYPAAGGAQ